MINVKNDIDKKNTYINDILENTLSMDYFRYENFFKKICEENYKYVILLTRRCLILADMFIRAGLIKNKDIFISDYSICMILGGLEDNDKVCIVDDILIHGRKVSEIYRLLRSSGILSRNIDVCVCVKNEDSDNVDSEIKNIRAEREACDSMWRDCSNRIVESILRTETPYVSCVGYLETSIDFAEINDEFLSSYYEQANEILDLENIRMEIAYWNNKDSNILLNQIASLSCMRKYTYPSGKVIFVPYVFLKSFALDNIGELFGEIANICKKNGLKCLGNIFLSDAYDSSLINVLIEYKYTMLTMFISWVYGIYLCGKNDNIKSSLKDSIVEYSIVKSKREVIAELDNIDYTTAKNILFTDFTVDKYIHQNINLETEYENELSAEIENLFQGRDIDKISAWNNFVHSNFRLDERRAENGRVRFDGMPFGYILDRLRKTEISFEDKMFKLVGQIVSTCDIGRTSCLSTINETSGYVSNYISPGEQAYRIIVMSYLDEFQCLYKVIKERLNGETKKDAVNKFCDYINNGANEILTTYKNGIFKIKDDIISNIDSWQLRTMVKPMKDINLFREINKYTEKRKRGEI